MPQVFSNRPVIFFSWGKEGARESQAARERWLPQLHPDEKGQLSEGHEVISSQLQNIYMYTRTKESRQRKNFKLSVSDFVIASATGVWGKLEGRGGGAGVLLQMCDSGDSFLCVHTSPVVRSTGTSYSLAMSSHLSSDFKYPQANEKNGYKLFL